MEAPGNILLCYFYGIKSPKSAYMSVVLRFIINNAFISMRSLNSTPQSSGYRRKNLYISFRRKAGVFHLVTEIKEKETL
jgi:hypothetical protein